jgi:hypothetical protein
MFNPTPKVLRPFIPLRSLVPTPLRPFHVCKKQSRLFMFPFCIRFRRHLTSSLSARYRLMRKPLVQRLRQLKQCAKLLEHSKNTSVLQSTMMQLGLHLMDIHTAGLGMELSSGFVVQTFIFVLFLTFLVIFLQHVLSMRLLFISHFIVLYLYLHLYLLLAFALSTYSVLIQIRRGLATVVGS